MLDRVAHRRSASRLADRYFADQCKRLGPILQHDEAVVLVPDRRRVAGLRRVVKRVGVAAGVGEPAPRDPGFDRFRL